MENNLSQNILDNMREITDTDVSFSINSSDEVIRWDSIKELSDCGIIDSPTAVKKEIKYTNHGGNILAKVQVYNFKDEPVSYIRWFRIDDPVRGNGIGCDLYKLVINTCIPEENRIFIKPVNPKMESIAKNMNFSYHSNLSDPWMSRESNEYKN